MDENDTDLIPCLKCGYRMKPGTNCPECGPKLAIVDIGAKSAAMQTSLVAHKPGTTEALRASDGQRSLVADLSQDELLKITLTAKRRQNESGNQEICQILAEKLSSVSLWDIRHPVAQGGREQGVDCVLVPKGVGKPLNLQITRAYNDPFFWKSVHPSKSTNREATVGEYVQEIRNAIEKKAKRTPQKSEIVLVLDAIETAHSFEKVSESFRKQNGAWVRQLGFEAVWLVGPTAALTHRLDIT